MTITSRAILALSLVTTFFLLAAAGGPSNGWDMAVANWFSQFRIDAPGAAEWAGAFTILGGAPVTLGITAITALWLLARRMSRRALLLAAAILVERFLVDLLKDVVGRPRPHLEHLPESLAFPSAHAANSMAVYLAIALIVVPARYRRPAILLALAMTLAVGATRLVLGVHWTSDVLGGWIFGFLAVSIATAIGERSTAVRLETQHDIVARHEPPIHKD